MKKLLEYAEAGDAVAVWRVGTAAAGNNPNGSTERRIIYRLGNWSPEFTFGHLGADE